MRSEGYNSCSVCLSVCLFVCLSMTILALQATRRLMSDTNSFSATRARKVMWRFRFIGLYKVDDICASAIVAVIKDTLVRMNLSLSKC